MHNLYRSKRNRMIAGVAAGLGEFFSIDVVLIRLLWLLSLFLGGAGLLIYVIAWIIIPSEKEMSVKLDKVVPRTNGERHATEAAEKNMQAPIGGVAANSVPGEAEETQEGEHQGESQETYADENLPAAMETETCCGSRAGCMETPGKRRRYAGILLVVVGVIFLADQLFGPIFHYVWPLLLVIAGVCLLAIERREVRL